jgi:hypothetical protein
MADSNQEFPDDVNVVPAEDGSTWVEIASTGTEDEANLIKGFLEAEGLRAQVERVNFSMEPVNFGMMGEIRVYVGAEDERRAQELLKQREAEYERLDDDEETLVTDEGPAVVDESTEVDESATAEGDDGARS